MKNICKIKKAAIGSLFVIPATVAAGYLAYVTLYFIITTEVSWWPVYNLAPVIIYLLLYAIATLFLGCFLALIIMLTGYWLLLIMEIGESAKASS